MDYYWPVNDRSAVTWKRPEASGPAVPAKAAAPAPVATVRQPHDGQAAKPTPAPSLFEVQAPDGKWFGCSIASNGSKPGTYNITIKSKPFIDVPGFRLRDVRTGDLLAAVPTIPPKAAAEVGNSTGPGAKAGSPTSALSLKAGDRAELKTTSNTWIPCTITGKGNVSGTYNVHSPVLTPGHQDIANVRASSLRQPTFFESHREMEPQAQQERQTRKAEIEGLANKFAEAYWNHKKWGQEPAIAGLVKNKTMPHSLEKTNNTFVVDSKSGKALSAFEASAQGLREELSSLKALLYKKRGVVRQASGEHAASAAFFVSDDGLRCVQGAPDYIRARLVKLKDSPLAEGYLHAEASEGSCPERGYAQGPLPDVCLSQASLYLRKGSGLQLDRPPTSVQGGTAQRLTELCQ